MAIGAFGNLVALAQLGEHAIEDGRATCRAMVVFETGDGDAVLLGTQCLIALRHGRVELGDERRTLGLELADMRLDRATLLLKLSV